MTVKSIKAVLKDLDLAADEFVDVYKKISRISLTSGQNIFPTVGRDIVTLFDFDTANELLIVKQVDAKTYLQNLKDGTTEVRMLKIAGYFPMESIININANSIANSSEISGDNLLEDL